MKDVVENRKRISLARKLKLASLVWRENGLRWCATLLTYYFASKLAERSHASMDRLRRTRGIPGLNSAALNKEIWEAWDWSARGEEWTPSPEWKDSLLRCVLQREVAPGTDVLEIGPGGGRWTGPLLQRARRYVGIDISAACIEHCRQMFGAAHPQATFTLGAGSDLPGVANSSIDTIWSFDAFVHINRSEVERYADEFARVLKPGGVAVIHHGAVGGAEGGWRSNLTAGALQEIVTARGLQISRSFERWADGGTVHTLTYGDRVTVICKPVELQPA